MAYYLHFWEITCVSATNLWYIHLRMIINNVTWTLHQTGCKESLLYMYQPEQTGYYEHVHFWQMPQALCFSDKFTQRIHLSMFILLRLCTKHAGCKESQLNVYQPKSSLFQLAERKIMNRVFSCNLNSLIICTTGKLRTEFTSQTGKSLNTTKQN